MIAKGVDPKLRAALDQFEERVQSGDTWCGIVTGVPARLAELGRLAEAACPQMGRTFIGFSNIDRNAIKGLASRLSNLRPRTPGFIWLPAYRGGNEEAWKVGVKAFLERASQTNLHLRALPGTAIVIVGLPSLRDVLRTRGGPFFTPAVNVEI